MLERITACPKRRHMSSLERGHIAGALAQGALKAERLLRTIKAARSFDAARGVPGHTPGQNQFNMLQAMGLDPRVGKALSRIAVRGSGSLAWQISDPAGSNFIDPGEIDTP